MKNNSFLVYNIPLFWRVKQCYFITYILEITAICRGKKYTYKNCKCTRNGTPHVTFINTDLKHYGLNYYKHLL